MQKTASEAVFSFMNQDDFLKIQIVMHCALFVQLLYVWFCISVCFLCWLWASVKSATAVFIILRWPCVNDGTLTSNNNEISDCIFDHPDVILHGWWNILTSNNEICDSAVSVILRWPCVVNRTLTSNNNEISDCSFDFYEATLFSWRNVNTQ